VSAAPLHTQSHTVITSPANRPSGPSLLCNQRPLWVPYVLAVTLITALVTSVATVAFFQEKQRYRERASVATQNIARLLDQHISDVLDKIDVVLQSGVYFYHSQAALGRIGPADLNAYIAEQESLVPELDGLRILDKEGFVRFGKDIPSSHPVNLSDREFFIRARDDASAGLITSGPVFARIAQKWVMVFARRLTATDGSFEGVVYANLATSQFEKVFASVALGPHGAATLRTIDMALVHRVPDTKNAVGSKDVSNELREILQARPEGGEYIAATALDGIERSNAYRRLSHHPFYVLVGIGTKDSLDGWTQNVLIVSGLSGLAILVTGLAALIVYRAHRRLSADIAERIRIGQELERAIAERTYLNAELEIRAQEAEAANRAKNTFLANMSHELRTPMNGIIGMTRLALLKATEPKLRDQLGKIDQCSQHLLRIINDILDIAKIEAERLTLEQINFKLGEVLEIVVGLISHKALEKELKLHVELSPDLARLTLLGDPLRLSQILLNYTSNAVKFTEQGAITVRARVAEESAADVLVHFEVHDTGIGIASDVQARLFTAFEQADNSMTRKYGGTGLGLVISKRLAHLMGGEVGFDSSIGHGSTFWFTVRVGKAAAAVRSEPTLNDDFTAAAPLLHDHGTARILLVEDELINREVSLCLLKEVGVQVDLAEDGVQAVEMAKQAVYNLILMDLQMPNLNGIDATRAIRALPGYAQTPIVAITANAFDKDRKHCLDAGMNDHIAKPFDPDVLLATLNKWLT